MTIIPKIIKSNKAKEKDRKEYGIDKISTHELGILLEKK